MCGIAGLIDFDEDAKRYKHHYEEMLQRLSRRGPDENGTYLSEKACLLHARLSVVDVENGKQPMRRQWGEQAMVLVYNGELYNAAELRKELKLLGHTFQENSDTEVLLLSYMEWGEDCVAQLNGIYAFAIWDERQQRLFICRDRMGVKPFFYCLVNGKLIFASEIKALLCHPLVQPIVDQNGIAELILLGPGRTSGTAVFQQIKELKAGFCGTFSKYKGLQTRSYWYMEAKEHTESFGETIENVRYLVKDSIRRQTVSDVPLCAFLSGGLDSSAISALSEVTQTFSVDYMENDKYFKANTFQPNSDKMYIEQMTSFLGIKHNRIMLETDELVDALFEAVEARDLPGMADVDSSLLLFCRSVKNHATVALSGECADELFGGYPWYRDEKILKQNGFPWSQSTLYRSSFIKKGVLDEINPTAYVQQKYDETIQDTKVNVGDSDEEKRMKQMVRLNTDWFMQTLLDRKDRMSMYSGLEVRVPFCDHRIAEYMYNVPWEFKNHQGREKGLLREALRDVLPEDVLWRKKSPYPKTHHPMYLKKVSGILSDICSNPNAAIFDMLERSAVENLLKNTENTTPWYGQLMTTPQTIAYLIQMNTWLEKYHVRLVG